MLRIKVPAREFYDEGKQEFVETKEQVLIMEHSLISISKWEAKWHKPYLTKEKKTPEEIYDYIRCMTISPSNADPMIFKALTTENFDEIAEYIDNPMTATTITELKGPTGRREIITSEVLYYYMIAQNIPVEFEKWHINRLITLIKVCAIKNNPKQKKMSRAEIARQNRAINAARRKKFGTSG